MTDSTFSDPMLLYPVRHDIPPGTLVNIFAKGFTGVRWDHVCSIYHFDGCMVIGETEWRDHGIYQLRFLHKGRVYELDSDEIDVERV